MWRLKITVCEILFRGCDSGDHEAKRSELLTTYVSLSEVCTRGWERREFRGIRGFPARMSMNVARIPRNGSDNRGFPAGMDIITANLGVKSFSLAVNTLD